MDGREPRSQKQQGEVGFNKRASGMQRDAAGATGQRWKGGWPEEREGEMRWICWCTARGCCAVLCCAGWRAVGCGLAGVRAAGWEWLGRVAAAKCSREVQVGVERVLYRRPNTRYPLLRALQARAQPRDLEIFSSAASPFGCRRIEGSRTHPGAWRTQSGDDSVSQKILTHRIETMRRQISFVVRSVAMVGLEATKFFMFGACGNGRHQGRNAQVSAAGPCGLAEGCADRVSSNQTSINCSEPLIAQS